MVKMSSKAFVVTTIPDEYNAMQYLPEENHNEIYQFMQGSGLVEKRIDNDGKEILILDKWTINPYDYVVKRLDGSMAFVCPVTKFEKNFLKK